MLHVTHDEAVLADWYMPAAHGAQPVPAVYWPAVQDIVQVVDPAAEYMFVLHAVQLIAPDTVEYVLTAQFEQDAAFSAE